MSERLDEFRAKQQQDISERQHFSLIYLSDMKRLGREPVCGEDIVLAVQKNMGDRRGTKTGTIQSSLETLVIWGLIDNGNHLDENGRRKASHEYRITDLGIEVLAQELARDSYKLRVARKARIVF